MPGLTGREVATAWARCNTWGTPASVTRQILLMSDEGIEDHPQLVDDEAFGQTHLGAAEVGDRDPITPELSSQLRYEQLDSWIAAGCGSVAAPVVVSSVAASSLVAYSHAITLAPELTQKFTLAIDTTQYVKEIPSFKFRGWSIRPGENGRLMIGFPIVGNRVVYDSAVNINSTVWGASAAEIANRAFRHQGRFRMNIASGGALGATDCNSLVTDFEITNQRPLAMDPVVGSDYITEPDDDGFSELGMSLTFARVNTITANSMAVGFGVGREFKCDWLFQGAFINSETRRSLLIESPLFQITNFKATITGANQVKPVIEGKFKRALTAPTGMSGLTLPLRVTLVNMNSATLL